MLDTLLDVTPAEMDEALLIDAMTRSPAGGFVVLHGYVNREGEVADFLLNGAVSWESCLERSLDAVAELDPETVARSCPAAGGSVELATQALAEVRASWAESLRRLREGEGTTSTYTHLGHGVATLPTEPGVLYVWGLLVDRRVRESADYRPVKHSAKTMVKHSIINRTPCGKFRRFRLMDNFKRLVAANCSFVPEGTRRDRLMG